MRTNPSRAHHEGTRFTFLLTRLHLTQEPWGTSGCTDSGVPNGGPLSGLTGCPISARVSRWPLLNGAIVGPEDVVVEGRDHRYCCQFSTHSCTGPVVHNGLVHVECGGASRVRRAVPAGARAVCGRRAAPPMHLPRPPHPPRADGAGFAMVDAGFLGELDGPEGQLWVELSSPAL